MVILTAKDLTADDRMRLGGSLDKILQNSALDRNELFGEIETLATASVGVWSRLCPRRSAWAATAPARLNAVRDLQSRLEQVQAERDAALGGSIRRSRQARTHGRPPDGRRSPKNWSRPGQLLREQQQSIELLQAESEEAVAQQTVIEELRREIEHLRGHGADAAAAPACPEPFVAALRQPQQEVEKLRQGERLRGEAGRGTQAAQAQAARAGKRGSLRVACHPREAASQGPSSPRRKRTPRAPRQAAGPPTIRRLRLSGTSSFRTPSGGPIDPGQCRGHRELDWARAARPTGPQVSRSQDGPFVPVVCIEDLRDCLDLPGSVARPASPHPPSLPLSGPRLAPSSLDRAPSPGGLANAGPRPFRAGNPARGSRDDAGKHSRLVCGTGRAGCC